MRSSTPILLLCMGAFLLCTANLIHILQKKSLEHRRSVIREVVCPECEGKGKQVMESDSEPFAPFGGHKKGDVFVCWACGGSGVLQEEVDE